MPRPGPRPYDCVRRAWHSDRHHPMRGSLIQEIFRIVNEVHRAATRKNKEWQEKLPIVVLKAEEIMYSKANSEAEYSDLKTLWDRVTDAIDTIIRRDKSSETGQLLHPCIEAALQLGCTPKRSSRSQRNDTPSYYLRPDAAAPSSSDAGRRYGNHTTNYMHQYSQFMTTPIAFSPCLNSNSPFVQNKNRRCPILPKYFHANGNFHLPSSNSWTTYPLHYDNQTLFSETNEKPSDLHYHPVKHDEIECDLSLRLGCLEVPGRSTEKNGDLGTTCEDKCKLYQMSRGLEKDFEFFLKSNAEVPLDRPLSLTKDVHEDIKPVMRKRKAVAEHEQFPLRLRLGSL